ncbi:hypothetical protein DY218_31435 [Streptomyces triticagri]|uniref:Molecular chaperone DnaJ n=1 Tax=Streptomyces triticagri TaxID=2293568 RepID=A0A372LVS3_9ACTN|nr:hypothetical protein DY218_31435 [Streptomyces triticagri]
MVIVATERKPRTRRPRPAPCEPCKGAGEVSRLVRVGRSRRVIGEQTGMCLACLGTGHASE